MISAVENHRQESTNETNLYATPHEATAQEFVDFWAPQYDYGLEDLYQNNIGQPLTEARVYSLFVWKNGRRLSNPKRLSVQRNYIDRIPDVQALPQATTAGDFLAQFGVGGAIWRIFWLHCWQPDHFPIYDQHVHRAMRKIQNQQPYEIPTTDPEKVQAYLEHYLPFHQQHFQGIDQRRVDKALWFYGKFAGANPSFPSL